MTKGDLIVDMTLEDRPKEGYPVLTEEHPFLHRLVRFMATKKHWLGTATDLLKELNDKSTPPNTVTKLLNKFWYTLYYRDGIEIRFRRTNRKRIIEIFKNK